MTQVLYRKYRPKNFSDVLGQDHIIEPLSSSIKSGDFSHAYLFSGSRGTGKTSIARILAREIGTSPEDLYEIDAASYNSVDDIRELNSSAEALPYNSKYKVYILDEVHMLSKSAFNALLKTLEEPPQHVVFILATTEIQKVPETVISRCQTYEFNRPNKSVLKEAIKMICKKEKYQIDDSSLDLITMLGNGSFRDTYGVLQQVFAGIEGNKIEAERVETLLGVPKTELVFSYIKALADKEAQRGLEVVSTISEKSYDVSMFLSLVIDRVREILLEKITGQKGKYIAEEDQEFIKDIDLDKLNSKTLILLLETHEQIASSFTKTLPLELLIIRVCELE